MLVENGLEPASDNPIKKIIHISGSGSLHGGAEHCLLELVEYELSVGLECTVVAPAEGDFTLAAADMGAKSIVLPFSPWTKASTDGGLILAAKTICKLLRNCIAECALLLILKREQPSLVHINTSAVCTGNFSAKRLRIPVVWHVRELLNPVSGREFYNRNRQIEIIRSSEAVIAVSKAAADALGSGVGFDTLFTIYDFVPSPRRQPRSLFSSKSLKIGLIGNLNPAKGQFDCFLALRSLKARNISFQVIVAGDCSYEAYYSKITSFLNDNDLNQSVKFIGYVDNPYTVLQKCDICLNCSFSESFGRVTVEGLLAGCLVIGRDTSGTTELLSNNRGLLFSNSQALSDKLEWVFKNPAEAQKIALRGSDYAWNSFSNKENSINQILSVFAKASVERQTRE